MPAGTETAWNGLRLFAEEAGTLEQPEDRVRAVLGVSDGPLPEVGKETLQNYYEYLTAHLSFPFQARYPEPIGLHEEIIRTVTGGRLARSDEEPGLRISRHRLQRSPGGNRSSSFRWLTLRWRRIIQITNWLKTTGIGSGIGGKGDNVCGISVMQTLCEDFAEFSTMSNNRHVFPGPHMRAFSPDSAAFDTVFGGLLLPLMV